MWPSVGTDDKNAQDQQQKFLHSRVIARTLSNAYFMAQLLLETDIKCKQLTCFLREPTRFHSDEIKRAIDGFTLLRNVISTYIGSNRVPMLRL